MNSHRFSRGGVALLASFVAALVLSLTCVVPAWADPGNDEVENATVISCGQTVSSTTLKGSDDDFYRFTTPSDGTVQIYFNNPQYSSGMWDVYLRDLNGDTIDDYNFYADAVSHVGTKIGLPKGTYTIEVSPWGSSNGHTYSMRVDFAAASNWETEFNDDLETADTLALGATVNGSSMDSSDDDFYRFTTPSDGTVQIYFNNPQYSSGMWDVYLRDLNGDTIDDYNFYADAVSHVGTKIGLPKGTYTIEVSPWGSSNGHTYSMRVDCAAASNWETEFNDDLETADTLALGATVNGSSMDSSDDDFYRFTLTKATTVNINFNNPQYSSGMWDVYLRDSNGNTIDDFDFDADTTSHTTANLNLKAGTYTIEVSPWGGSYGRTYTLRVAEPPQSKDMHRLYNRWTGEHFYTASATERDSLTSVGWTYEGVGWVAPTSGQKVYRLYNPFVEGGDHHYTMDVEEYNTLETLGWRKEGVGWYSGGTVKVYRQYNRYATTGTHNYTTDKNENDALVKLGWKAEGVGWYAYAGRK